MGATAMTRLRAFVVGFVFAGLGIVLGAQVTKFPASGGGASSDQDLNTTDSVEFAGVSIDEAPVLRKITMAPPTGLVAEAFDGGSLPAGAYHFKVVAIAPGQGAEGDPTLPSAEVSAVVPLENDGVGSISIGWDDTPWAAGYRLYVGISGAGSQDEFFSPSTSDFFMDTLPSLTDESTTGTPPDANTAIFYALSLDGQIWVVAGDAIPSEDGVFDLGLPDSRFGKAYVEESVVVGIENGQSIALTQNELILRATLAEAASPVKHAPKVTLLGSYWDGAAAQDIDTFIFVEVTDEDPLTYRSVWHDATLASDLLAFDQAGVATFAQDVTLTNDLILGATSEIKTPDVVGDSALNVRIYGGSADVTGSGAQVALLGGAAGSMTGAQIRAYGASASEPGWWELVGGEAVGEDVSGHASDINGTRGTGAGVGGPVVVNISPPGSSGASQNGVAEVFRVDHLGAMFSKVYTAAPAAGDCNDAAHTGRFAWDSTNNIAWLCSGASGWRQIATAAP